MAVSFFAAISIIIVAAFLSAVCGRLLLDNII